MACILGQTATTKMDILINNGYYYLDIPTDNLCLDGISFIEIIEFYINEFELNDDYHFGYGENGITTCSGKFKIKPFISYGKKQLDINQ